MGLRCLLGIYSILLRLSVVIAIFWWSAVALLSRGGREAVFQSLTTKLPVKTGTKQCLVHFKTPELIGLMLFVTYQKLPCVVVRLTIMHQRMFV
jgi:hypothetical protein